MQKGNHDPIELHMRMYRSYLKSAGQLDIHSIIDSHLAMNSILHEKGVGPDIDIAALIYTLLRLPHCTSNVRNIILGQSYSVFKLNGYPEIKDWKEVVAPGRRRKMLYDGRDTLAVYIASVTDLDDLITLLTSFEIEWNKFHTMLKDAKNVENEVEKLLPVEDIIKIKKIWGGEYHKLLTAVKYRSVDFTVKLLSGSYVEYAKSTKHWWDNIEEKLKKLEVRNKPIYFISSNIHSVVNILTGFAVSNEKALIEYLYQSGNSDLINIWEEIKTGKSLAYRENFLYYLSKKYGNEYPDFLKKRKRIEVENGINYIPASHFLDIDAQVVELGKLNAKTLGIRTNIDLSHLSKSEALVINIDYPLGWAAYQVLTEICQNLDGELRGIYIMGKAATLNGNIGDIMLPSTIFDDHTKNTYAINNAFSKKDFLPIFKTGSVLDNQKTITVKGTFFENKNHIYTWFKKGNTTIEMEAGPYLNAVYENVFYNRYEENQFVNLTNTPFELGIAHYASDTPNSKAKNLGVRNLSYEGVEPTYAISLAIIRKIIEREKHYF